MSTRSDPAVSYGRFPDEIERDWLGRWCHLSEADVDLVDRHDSDTTRLSFAVQLATVRAADTFFAEPTDGPDEVVGVLARQLKIADPGALVGYAKLPAR